MPAANRGTAIATAGSARTRASSIPAAPANSGLVIPASGADPATVTAPASSPAPATISASAAQSSRAGTRTSTHDASRNVAGASETAVLRSPAPPTSGRAGATRK